MGKTARTAKNPENVAFKPVRRGKTRKSAYIIANKIFASGQYDKRQSAAFSSVSQCFKAYLYAETAEKRLFATQDGITDDFKRRVGKCVDLSAFRG
jgi:hypothetical protein